MSAEINTTNAARVRLADLMKHEVFQCLTKKQQIFVAKLVALGLTTGNYDHVAAAAFAYRTKNPQVLGAELLGQAKIRRCLDVHFRRSNLESILDHLGRAAKKSVKRGEGLSPETVKALAVFAQYVQKETSNVAQSA